MTTLGLFPIKKTKKWIVHKHICGDLSFSYEVRPIEWEHDTYVTGFGIPANSLKDVNKIIQLCDKHGYKKARDIWDKTTMNPGSGYHFGYLTGKEAKKYAKDEDAYGEYARRYKKKKRPANLGKKKIKR